jgi:predicted porin
MQLKLIAMAVAGVLAAPAFAQSNVVVYGRISEAYSTFNHDSVGLREDQSSTSRLGFKGTEEISSDLSAFFALEHRFTADNGNTSGPSTTGAAPGFNTSSGGTFWGEKAYFGLQSKAAGSVSFGRISSPAYSGMGGNFDAFGGDTIISNPGFGKRGRVSNYFENGGRYDSPNWGGFDFTVAASTGEGLGNSTPQSSSGASATAGEKKAAYGLLAHFSPGNLRTEFSWQHDVSGDNGRGGLNPAGGSTITTTAPNNPYNTTAFAVSYDFGVMSLAVSTARGKGYNTKVGNQIVGGLGVSDSWVQSSMVNVVAPIGAHSIHFQYDFKKEKGPGDLNGGKAFYAPSYRAWGLGYWYSLSKRTTFELNTSFAQQRSTSFKAASGTITTGFASGTGDTFSSQKGLELVLNHDF